eukprot:6238188-Prymnesium_polylepis.1
MSEATSESRPSAQAHISRVQRALCLFVARVHMPATRQPRAHDDLVTSFRSGGDVLGQHLRVCRSVGTPPALSFGRERCGLPLLKRRRASCRTPA